LRHVASQSRYHPTAEIIPAGRATRGWRARPDILVAAGRTVKAAPPVAPIARLAALPSPVALDGAPGAVQGRLMDRRIDPRAESKKYGHTPVPCKARHSTCPPTEHCATCAEPIEEGYRPGFGGERVWTHDVAGEDA
jgi:hypothetical protein